MKSFLEYSNLTEAVLTLTPGELYRYDWVVDQFIYDYKNGVPFKLVSGKSVILKYLISLHFLFLLLSYDEIFQ